MRVQIEVVDLQTLPPERDVLTPAEQTFYETLRFPKRRTEWFGGRVALKRLVAAHEKIALNQVEILPAPEGKPTVTVVGKKWSGAFSITHSHGFAVAAISQSAKYLGIDLEKTAPRINAWKTDFFHPDELTGEGDEFLTALWTQKEAVVKLLGTGLSLKSFDVRCVNGHVQFYGRALEIYEQLGRPDIRLTTSARLPGFMFSVAVGREAVSF